MTFPSPSFAHLEQLTDHIGLFEHAEFAEVRPEHGYCTDDAARGLVVACRESDPSSTVAQLADRYLAFVVRAQASDGAFRNRLGPDGCWTDEPGLGDWWGRALWGLATAAVRGPTPAIRAEARRAFDLGATSRSPHPRAMVFAGLGAAEVLRADPADTVAGALLEAAAAAVGQPSETPGWSWPQARLTYANAALAEVVIAAGHLRGDQAQHASGLRMLSWLRDVQLHDGRLSVIAATGWRYEGRRARHDQQPIEVAAFADACATAAGTTGDHAWVEGVHQAAGWFMGVNDTGVVMWDPDTGGGYDGLTPDGPNLNQGAESTLALISTLQRVRDVE
jgi:hypothetical protein